MGASSGNPQHFDIDARQAQVVGERPRIAPLDPGALDPEAKALAVTIRESLGLTDHSNMPELFATMLKHPDLYQCQMKMGIQLYQGALPPRERELAVLRVGWLCRAPYEWGQHVDIAKRYGVTDEEIERVTQSSAAPGWSAHDAAILRGVEELLGDQMISDATWNQLARSWSERQLIEFPTLVGQYVAIAYSHNALRVRLPAELKDGLRHR
jgi:4-carboxymuconolactone decarboxylase